jgi:hypothetical protein
MSLPPSLLVSTGTTNRSDLQSEVGCSRATSIWLVVFGWPREVC